MKYAQQPYDLITWEAVKLLLNLDDDKEDICAFLIHSVSRSAEHFSKRWLAARDVELKFDSSGKCELLTPTFPINKITRLAIDSTRVFATTSDVEAKNFSYKKEYGFIYLYNCCGCSIPCGRDTVFFSGNIGYDPIPEDLQHATVDAISHNLRRLQTSGGQAGIKSLNAGQNTISTTFEIDIPLQARSIFLQYRDARI